MEKLEFLVALAQAGFMGYVLFVLILTCAIAAAVIARNRSNSDIAFVCFFIGLFAGPVGVALAFAAGKRCPACHERIHVQAGTCRFCATVQPERAPAISKKAIPASHFAIYASIAVGAVIIILVRC